MRRALPGKPTPGSASLRQLKAPKVASGQLRWVRYSSTTTVRSSACGSFRRCRQRSAPRLAGAECWCRITAPQRAARSLQRKRGACYKNHDDLASGRCVRCVGAGGGSALWRSGGGFPHRHAQHFSAGRHHRSRNHRLRPEQLRAGLLHVHGHRGLPALQPDVQPPIGRPVPRRDAHRQLHGKRLQGRLDTARLIHGHGHRPARRRRSHTDPYTYTCSHSDADARSNAYAHAHDCSDAFAGRCPFGLIWFCFFEVRAVDAVDRFACCDNGFEWQADGVFLGSAWFISRSHDHACRTVREDSAQVQHERREGPNEVREEHSNAQPEDRQPLNAQGRVGQSRQEARDVDPTQGLTADVGSRATWVPNRARAKPSASAGLHAHHLADLRATG